MYSRFDLILPKDSKVIRTSKNELLIDTPVLSMAIEIIHDGFSTVLKSGFHRCYLGITDAMRDYRDYAFAIKVTVKFKIRSLFSKEKEIYYAWVDSFLDSLASYASKEQFFETINWDATYSLLRCVRNISMRGNKVEQRPEPKVSYTIIEEDDE